jgi:hypothetical protein
MNCQWDEIFVWFVNNCRITRKLPLAKFQWMQRYDSHWLFERIWTRWAVFVRLRRFWKDLLSGAHVVSHEEQRIQIRSPNKQAQPLLTGAADRRIVPAPNLKDKIFLFKSCSDDWMGPRAFISLDLLHAMVPFIFLREFWSMPLSNHTFAELILMKQVLLKLSSQYEYVKMSHKPRNNECLPPNNKKIAEIWNNKWMHCDRDGPKIAILLLCWSAIEGNDDVRLSDKQCRSQGCGICRGRSATSVVCSLKK